MAFSPDGTKVAAVGDIEYNFLCVYDVSDGDVLYRQDVQGSCTSICWCVHPRHATTCLFGKHWKQTARMFVPLTPRTRLLTYFTALNC